MATVNIFGSCVSRDVFNYVSSQLEVANYLGRNSIVSMNLNPVYHKGINAVKFDALKDIKWEDRMVFIDGNKWGFKYLDNKADWIVIDLLDERFGVCVDSDSQFDEVRGLTYSQVFARSKYVYDFIDYKKRLYSARSAEVKTAISNFIKEIKKIYREDHIIINKAFPSLSYIGKDGMYHLFDQAIVVKALGVTEHIGFMYDELQKQLPDSHVIDMDHNILADENHKWKLAYMHYESRYYIKTANVLETIIL